MDVMSYIGVFIEGLASFMSPCILPLIPLYMAYLTNHDTSDDRSFKRRLKIFFLTFSFVLGISTVYFILAIASSAIREMISDIGEIITLIGGVILIFIALFELGIIDIKPLNRELSIKDRADVKGMNYLKAFVLGFLFSFAWTPCVGPFMASVLLMASTSEAIVGNLLILFYALGFTIPFLIIGIFYDVVLSFIKKHQGTLIKITKLASIVIILFGAYMVYDASSSIYKTKAAYNDVIPSKAESDDSTSIADYGFYDQFGNLHRISDYKGKYIAFNFVASWCTYCINEIDEYKAFAESDDSIVSFYVMSEDINSQSGNMTTDEFIAAYDIDISVLDDDGTLFTYLNITSFPTIAFFGPDGTYIGYQSGALDRDMMDEVYRLAKERYESR